MVLKLNTKLRAKLGRKLEKPALCAQKSKARNNHCVMRSSRALLSV